MAGVNITFYDADRGVSQGLTCVDRLTCDGDGIYGFDEGKRFRIAEIITSKVDGLPMFRVTDPDGNVDEFRKWLIRSAE